MIKVDLSNVVPRRVGTYLVAILPGLVFIISIALGDPGVIHHLLDRLRETYSLSPYALLFLFTFSSFVVGQTFFLAAWFVEVALVFVYRLPGFCMKITFGSHWMYKLLGKAQRKGPNRNAFLRVFSWLIFRARTDRRESATKMVLKCWRTAAVKLLELYGFDHDESHQLLSGPEGEAWYAILGKPSAQLQESLMVMRTILGCGLALIAAIYVSPDVRNRFVASVAIVFTAAGCFQLLSLIRWQENSTQMALVRLKSVLREISELSGDSKKEANKGGREFKLTADIDGTPKD